eukprot:CAMPEP_0205820082 /NCGR_PEP_ID=MMETSP0206-20130828/2672_1 /ASSEMBLY_ACC=CAM_ASM_000279 /TAXON_ID=36767 /ORGANISM="Euplotes focardii, Strain TN1" /LENGTH=282 /DNA_ID=CAMNT_0053114443 /DNA_START=17 /DNA_END=865 /DNA_ORIENTATION=+
MKNLLILSVALAAILGITLSAVAIDLDRDGIADLILPSSSVTTIVEPGFGWRDEWAVRPGRQGVHDWNNDGVIDWKDDFIVGGVQPWSGDYIRADWNRDGVIDSQDGWRRLDNTWATGTWDPTYRGEGWRPETVSVREVSAGLHQDTDWQSVDGPWDSFGWGGAVVADWNRDGVIDYKDDLAWRGVGVGFGVGQTELVSVREVTAPGVATTFGGQVSGVRGGQVSGVRGGQVSSVRGGQVSSVRGNIGRTATTVKPSVASTVKPAVTTKTTTAPKSTTTSRR